MPKAKVAILRTNPETVFDDYHRLMNLAGYQDVIAKDVDTALKVNISWHFFFPTTRSWFTRVTTARSSSTPTSASARTSI